MAIPPKVDRIEVLLDKLGFIGTVKANLPLPTRAWLNDLGLYVRLQYVSGEGYLMAGGEFKSYFNAYGKKGEPITNWSLKSFNRGIWNKRFAILVWPSFELALYIGGPLIWNTSVLLPDGKLGKLSELDTATYEEVNQIRTNIVKAAITQFNRTREWSGVAHFFCEKCNRALYVWEIQNKICPYCNSPLL